MKIIMKFKVSCCIHSPCNQKLSSSRHTNTNSTLDCKQVTLMENIYAQGKQCMVLTPKDLLFVFICIILKVIV